MLSTFEHNKIVYEYIFEMEAELINCNDPDRIARLINAIKRAEQRLIIE